MRKYALLWAALALAAGILVEERAGEFLSPFTIAGTALSMLLVLLFEVHRNHRNAAVIGGVLFLCALGAGRFFLADTLWERQSHWAVQGEGTYTGIVMEPPLVQQGPGGYIRYLLDLESLTYDDGAIKSLTGRAYAYEPLPGETCTVGDRVVVRGKLSPLRLYNNPGKMDLASRYKSMGLLGRLYPKDGKAGAFSSLGDSGSFRTGRWASLAKERLADRFAPYMDKSRLALLMTLLFGGQYGELAPGLVNSFSVTGIVHILSVSGSHMALLFGFLYLLGKWLRLPGKVTMVCSMGLVMVYALLSGLVPPVIRAVSMGILAVGGLFLERERVSLNLLGAVILTMLLVDPFYLFDVSFQLSAGAAAGILLFYKPILSFLLRFRRLPKWIGEGIALSTSAQLLTIPVVLYDFHVFPLYFIPANLFVTPFLEWAIIAGLLAALVSFVAAPLMAGLLQLADYLLLFGIRGNTILSALPHASLPTGGMTLLEILLYYWALGLVYFHKAWRSWKWKLLPGGVGFLLLGALVFTLVTTPRTVLYVPDLGLDQGAILANGRQKILYYKAGPLPGYTAGYEWNSILGYEGVFDADILILNLEEAKDPIPLSMTCRVGEIWMVGGDGEKLAPQLLSGSGAKVRRIEKGKLGLGDMTFTTNGSSFLLSRGDGGLYLSGRRPLRKTSFPSHIAWVLGNSGFKQSLSDERLAAVRPEAVFYNGSRRGESYEDLELLDLAGVPAVNTAEGMGTAVFKKGWKCRE